MFNGHGNQLSEIRNNLAVSPDSRLLITIYQLLTPMHHLHHFFLTHVRPWVTTQNPLHNQEAPNNHTSLLYNLLPVLTTGGFMPAVAIGMQVPEGSVVRRKGLLIQIDNRNTCSPDS